jgi:acetolactate synthase-1/2/3 large subunit
LLLAPVTKRAWTEHQADHVGAAVDEAFRIAATAHRGPVFLDFSLEALFGEGRRRARQHHGTAAPPPAPADVDVIAGLLAGASPRAGARLGCMAGRGGGRRPAAAEDLRLL